MGVPDDHDRHLSTEVSSAVLHHDPNFNTMCLFLGNTEYGHTVIFTKTRKIIKLNNYYYDYY